MQNSTVKIRFRFAVGSILILWLAYTVLFSLYLSDALMAVLGFIPGILGIGVLLASGLTTRDCYLRVAPISRKGLTILALLFLLLPAILSAGQWIGWNLIAVLVFAPASGISQELFFRAALLPALVKTFEDRWLLAVSLQSAMFALWHVGVFLVAPLGGAIAVMVVTFLSGMVWGWQVQHDNTIIWAAAQHILFLMVMSLYGL